VDVPCARVGGGQMSVNGQPQRLVFRADASSNIGTGHVMRCLTLADALRASGADSLFLCRPMEGDLIGAIRARGHRVRALPECAPHVAADWTGEDQVGDAECCSSALAHEPKADWFVVDHYGLDYIWESMMRPFCRRLMVIDDLADRAHDCDLLLDPGLGRCEADYADLLPPTATRLLGPQHALLRPEFAAHRTESLARRVTPALKRILVTLGGSDSENVTCKVLDALDSAPLPAGVEITVVMGPSAPWLDAVRLRASAMRAPTLVLSGVSNMARLMTDSDLAIGAAGSTAWERCCLGLPSIQMVLADNQREIANTLQASGAAPNLASAEEITPFLTHRLTSGSLTRWLRDVSNASAGIVAGDGVDYVRAWMEGQDA
jgi:UDP-2,4-diacetamido-2,4,6-trideoxy-beta-L-altropyranose hydrolase